MANYSSHMFPLGVVRLRYTVFWIEKTSWRWHTCAMKETSEAASIVSYCWDSNQHRSTDINFWVVVEKDERRTDLWSFWMHFQCLICHMYQRFINSSYTCCSKSLSSDKNKYSHQLSTVYAQTTHLIFPVVDQKGQKDHSIITMLPSTGHIRQNLWSLKRKSIDDKKKRKDCLKVK